MGGRLRDFRCVVRHVLYEEDVIVQGFFVVGVVRCGRAHGLMGIMVGGEGGGRVLGDGFEAVEHGFVNALVGVVHHASDLEVGLVVWCKLVSPLFCGRGRRGDERFDGGAKGWENAHECNDAFSLFDLDFCVFDGADLLVDASVEERCEVCVQSREGMHEEFVGGGRRERAGWCLGRVVLMRGCGEGEERSFERG